MNKQLMTTAALLAALSFAAPSFAQDASASAGAGVDTSASAGSGDTSASAGAGGDASASAGAGDTSASAGAGTDVSASAGTSGVSAGVDASTSASAAAGNGSASVGIQTDVDVNITVEQTTEIKQVIVEAKPAPVTVDFDITLGVAVPSTVALLPLPARVVELVPQFNGFLFFVLADGRIVIVAPDTLKIVAILTV